MKCSNCGNDVVQEASFCMSCGTRIGVTVPVDVEVSQRNPMKPQAGTMQCLEGQEVDAETYAQELKLFVKEKQEYYLLKWRLMDNSSGAGRVLSWNWGAFLLSVAWLGFRKMYVIAFVSACILLAVNILQRALGFPDAIALVIDLITWVSFGLFGNYVYRTYTDRKLVELRTTYPDMNARKMKIGKVGGASALGAIGVGLMMMVIFFGAGYLLSTMNANGSSLQGSNQLAQLAQTARPDSRETSMNRDCVQNDLYNLASRAQQYYRRPAKLGGGAGSFVGTTIEKLTSKPANINGTYSIVSAENQNSLTLEGIGREVGQDGVHPLQLTAIVTPENVEFIVNN